MSHIPEGFQTVSPYFIVENAPGFIAFLEKAFDATLVYKHSEREVIVYARVRIGNSLIELSETTPNFKSIQFVCQLFVEDSDATFKKAVEAGAITLKEPVNTPYGLHAGYVMDAWGNNWHIATQIESNYSPNYWDNMFG